MATVSVSKGVFVFKNGVKAAPRKSRKKKKATETLFCDSLWYTTYKSLWSSIESKLQDLNNDMFSNILSSLISYIDGCYNGVVSEIPAAALLTGINMPDHTAQFQTLKSEIKRVITPHVCILNGEDCQNIKYLVEVMVNQLIKNEDLDDEDDSENPNIKKFQCNFSLLQSWYEELYIFSKEAGLAKKQRLSNASTKNVIVIIIPDFENFVPKVLQDFILIASTYINVLPFVFAFGVATSLSVVHRSLPCHVSSKIKIEVFHSSQSTLYLNNVIENIFFSQDCPFHLGEKVFNLFTDIFLFYDLSVNGFIQNFKYAMLEHFSIGNAMALCQKKHVKNIIEELTKDDLEGARRVLSFRKLVENEEPEIRIRLLTDDVFFKSVLRKEVKKIAEYLPNFHLFLRCLNVLVCDLPKAPLGKQVRELYAFAVSKKITSTAEYKECLQLLSFQSREELNKKLIGIMEIILNNVDENFISDGVQVLLDDLNKYLHQLHNLETGEEEENHEEEEQIQNKDVLIELMDRLDLKEKLRQISQQKKPMNQYEKIRSNLLNFLTNLFEEVLVDPTSFYFHEIFFFNDISIKNHIIGTHRAAIHTALNDPHFYLQCPCCEIANDTIILQSMPDISIVYKLHLECGKMINLYDWLQAFLTIVDPQDLDEDEKPKVKPEYQARFTQAVAELEYLGFVKSSKRKADHVARLTWGG